MHTNLQKQAELKLALNYLLDFEGKKDQYFLSVKLS